jgi:hypothetical protein
LSPADASGELHPWKPEVAGCRRSPSPSIPAASLRPRGRWASRYDPLILLSLFRASVLQLSP